ncbi:MAG: Fic family protein [Candidatus Sumerlaeota bacterium]|nr:Fic family protein [Candidatus Sumerlaeota bacterium]
MVDGKYLHWDKLLYHTPPKPLSHEEWWAGLKMRRLVNSKSTPLGDTKDIPFQYNECDPIPERLHEIDLSLGGAIQTPEKIVNAEARDQYIVSSLIAEAITSSQLEGATTTRQVAKEMIRTGRPPRDVSEQMILNNYQTMEHIREIKNEPLTPEIILDIHRRLTHQTLDDPAMAGRLRGNEVRVEDNYGEVFHYPPTADQLEGRMAVLCDFANSEIPSGFIHPVIRSIILHFGLAYDHPFVDGNGRTARALFYWSMLRHGYWLFEFVSISQIIRNAPTQYALAYLYTETDGNDLTYFILYHLEVIRRAVQALQEYIERKSKQIQQVESGLRGIALFNYRQQALLSHALRHAHQRYTIEGHRASHNVAYETARRDLLELSDRGLLVPGKTGKTRHFMPAKDFEDQLARLSQE